MLPKATLGFGSVVWLGSSVLSKIFALVAQARSTDTFVALCLLVSVSIIGTHGLEPSSEF